MFPKLIGESFTLETGLEPIRRCLEGCKSAKLNKASRANNSHIGVTAAAIPTRIQERSFQ